MTTISVSRKVALHDAIDSAVLAPSVHNTQPWRFAITAAGLEIFLDRSRQLPVLDPSGRQLVLSVGCALFNARVSLAASGLAVEVDRLPDATRPDLLAHLRVCEGPALSAPLAALGPAVGARQSNRRNFTTEEVPDELIALLVDAARSEGAHLQAVLNEDDRRTLARLSQRADAQQVTNPAYRAELRSWTTDDASRRDGVRAEVVPHVDGTAHDEIPMRDFDTRGSGALPAGTQSSAGQCLLILSTDGDGPESWVRGGEALERVWLEATHAGFASSVFTQVIEEAGLRAQLRDEVRLQGHPHVVIRVGHAAATTRSLRRPVEDMLHDPLPRR